MATELDTKTWLDYIKTIIERELSKKRASGLTVWVYLSAIFFLLYSSYFGFLISISSYIKFKFFVESYVMFTNFFSMIAIFIAALINLNYSKPDTIILTGANKRIRDISSFMMAIFIAHIFICSIMATFFSCENKILGHA